MSRARYNTAYTPAYQTTNRQTYYQQTNTYNQQTAKAATHQWLLNRPITETYAQRRETFINNFDPSMTHLQYLLQTCTQHEDETTQSFAQRYLTLIERTQSTMDNGEIAVQFILKLLPHIRIQIINKVAAMNYDMDKIIKACEAIDTLNNYENNNYYYSNNKHPLTQRSQQQMYTAEVTVEGIHMNTTLINKYLDVSAISYNYFRSLPLNIRQGINYENENNSTIINDIPMRIIGQIPLTFQIGSFPIQGNTCELSNVRFKIIPGLSTDCIIGQDIIQQYFDGINTEEYKLNYGSRWNEHYFIALEPYYTTIIKKSNDEIKNNIQSQLNNLCEEKNIKSTNPIISTTTNDQQDNSSTMNTSIQTLSTVQIATENNVTELINSSTLKELKTIDITDAKSEPTQVMNISVTRKDEAENIINPSILMNKEIDINNHNSNDECDINPTISKVITVEQLEYNSADENKENNNNTRVQLYNTIVYKLSDNIKDDYSITEPNRISDYYNTDINYYDYTVIDYKKRKKEYIE